VKASRKLDSVITTIIQRVQLADFLSENYERKEILLCPTQAISVSKNAIDGNRCIACGICKKLISDSIEYYCEGGDLTKFIKYCGGHKMFVYNWLCLTTDSLSGIEVFITGFSRTKRIPLVGFSHGFLEFTKCAYSISELDMIYADLNDMAYLASRIADLPRIEKSIVLIQDPSNQKENAYLGRVHGYKLLRLTELYTRLTNTFQ
jgi:ferredoxin